MTADPSAPVPPADVTVVVVTWQGAHLLTACLDSLRRQTVAHRVVVVDNASTDGTAELLDARDDVQVVRCAENTGFAGGVQAGLDEVRTSFAALLNNDAVASENWLAALLAAAERHPDAAAITSLLLLAGSRPPVVNNAGVVVLDSWYGADRAAGADPATVAEPVEVFGFSGGAALLRTAAVRAVGGFDPRYFLYYEDTELAWRLREAGWTVWFEPTAVVVHQHAASTDPRSRLFAHVTERNRLWMLWRHAPVTVAVGVTVRFVVTTVSLVVHPAPAVDVGPPWNLRPGVRWSVLLDALRGLPQCMRGRRRAQVVDPRRLR